MSYARIQAIRESAGLLSRVSNETPNGAVDGNNRVFIVKRRPIVDGNYDDAVTEEDVHVFVSGVPVVIEDIEPLTGKITLRDIPLATAKVTVDYQFSPITDDYTEGKQEEADSWVDLKLKPYLSKGYIDTLPLTPVPGIISTVAEMYAAGLILTRDWGSRVDSEQTSKDGYQKLKTARDLLADYITSIENDNSANNTNGDNSVSVMTDGDVFDRELGDRDCDDQDRFMRPGANF